uniref:Scamp family-domain-containing protein n=1 Tax=Strongyloides venezuelensis TaxID=75913 RepID=A0A0K0F1D2_STRVS
MTTQHTVSVTCSTSGDCKLDDFQEERVLKQRLIDEKTKESKSGVKDDSSNLMKPSQIITKIMSYDWTCLDMIIILYYFFSALSFARAFSSFILLLPSNHGMFYIFLGIYWFICIYPTYKFFTNLNVRGAVLVHNYINLISGGAIVAIVALTFWNSRYINESYYSFYMTLLFHAFLQFISIIVLSLFPFKVIQTRAIGKLSAECSMKFSEACVNGTIKTYNNAANYVYKKFG